MGYDGLLRLTSVTGGPVSRQYTYQDVDSVKTTMQVASVTSGGQQYGYTYDSMGNIATYSATYAAPGKGTVTYTYDNQGQLLSAAGDTTYTYTYDGAGNILTASDGETISLDDINESNAYAGDYEEMFYFVGDFSSAVDNMKAYSGKYNLYTNNCSQVSLRILADANIDYRELFSSAAEYISPKRAKKYISENIDNFMQTGMRYYKAALQIYNMLF